MDEEQLKQLNSTLDLLFNAGYFRSKLQGLGNFDKIVGGITWCISLCAHKVDVDLLYSENQTIGQKIALTERIVKVLPKINCPFSLEPHQIQGLDFEHIYPVVQWLITEANFVRERLGDETRNFAVYLFDQQRWKIDNELERSGLSGALPMVKRQPKKVYRRVMRMERPMRGGTKEESRSEGTEMEEEEKRGGEEQLLVMMEGTTEAGKNILVYMEPGGADEVHDAKLSASAYSILKGNNFTEEWKMLEEEAHQLNEEHLLENDRSMQFDAELDQLSTQKGEIDHIPMEIIDQFFVYLAEKDKLKADESAIKAHYRQKLAEMDAKIEKLELSQDNGVDAGSNDDSDREFLDKLIKAKNLDAELKKLNHEISRLGRKAGTKPSQTELGQYQRRLVELCNQTSSTYNETKRQYTLYNTLANMRNFMHREMKLLNNIDDQREQAQREEYSDSLLQNLQQIGRGVDDSLDKMLCKKRALQEQRDQLHSKLQTLLDKQRLYTKTLVEFQQECQRSEQLREETTPLPEN